MRKLRQMTEFNPVPAFHFLQITLCITQNIADDAVIISHVREQHSWYSASNERKLLLLLRVSINNPSILVSYLPFSSKLALRASETFNLL